MAHKKKQKKKNKEKIEFVFNVCSLIVIICIGLYFGGRSFYYYSKQNNKKRLEEHTLNGMVLTSNYVVQKGTGLHQDTNGYYFKGKVENNYVSFANRLYRIIRVHNNHTIQLIQEDLDSSFMWGNSEHYQNSNLQIWLSKNELTYSGVYYETIPAIDKFLVKTKYQEDQLLNNKVKKSKTTSQDFITPLMIQDYIQAGGSDSYLNIGKYFWVLGENKEKDHLYIDSEGAIQVAEEDGTYGIRPVITLKKNLKVKKGIGTKEDPYVIEQGKDTNDIDQYVKLGNDLWKVYYDKDNLLRLSLDSYMKVGNQEYVAPYSRKDSLYNIESEESIGYVLNHLYYSSLPYATSLLDCSFPIGELSMETSFQYQSIYTSSLTAKVGLLNIFDYNTNASLDNYYFMNTTSSVGGMVYIYHPNGLLEEDIVEAERHIIPSICIDKRSLKSGDGSRNNPYVTR